MTTPIDQQKIRAIVLQLSKVIQGATRRLQAIRQLCKHPNVIKTPRSDTGNWCSQDDRYWYDCKCPDCGKLWTENQ